MILTIKTERETDGGWIAEIPEWPGCIAYGATEEAAIHAAVSLAFQVIEDIRELRQGEAGAAVAAT